ncbi:MAG: hypothetical protein HDT39_10960 [Lachnospiraceae bacterium]|nr:hypothetical protein [Lachnospiraceae bacterium]
MVNRIGDSNSYISQPKVSSKRHTKSDNQFSIDYNNDDTKTDNHDNSEVKVELSTYEKIPEEVVVEYSFLSDIKDRLSEVKEILKSFWDRIWNGSPKKEEIGYENKTITDMSLEEVSNYVSDNGRKKPAKNSDILTTYNQFGKIVEINPSEKNKIFHGNKSWKEL